MSEPLGSAPARSGLKGFWQRRSRWGKTLIIGGGVLILFAVIGAFADEGAPPKETVGETATVVVTETVAVTETAADTAAAPPAETESESEPEPAPEPEPEPQAAKPIIVRGSGARVATVAIPSDGPLVVGGVHRGSSNFQVELVGTGGTDAHEFLFNEIGTYSGEVAVAEARSGRYRVAVEADGPWTLFFRQPEPSPSARKVPGTISGRGAKVVQIRADEDLQPVVDATHRGQSNFQVNLIGLADVTGESFLFNEIGVYSGQTLVDEMPQGNYLLAVQADGAWSLKFTP